MDLLSSLGSIFDDVDWGRDFVGPLVTAGVTGGLGFLGARNTADEAHRLQEENNSNRLEEIRLNNQGAMDRVLAQLSADKEALAAKNALEEKIWRARLMADAYSQMQKAALEGRQGESTALRFMAELLSGIAGKGQTFPVGKIG